MCDSLASFVFAVHWLSDAAMTNVFVCVWVVCFAACRRVSGVEIQGVEVLSEGVPVVILRAIVPGPTRRSLFCHRGSANLSG